MAIFSGKQEQKGKSHRPLEMNVGRLFWANTMSSDSKPPGSRGLARGSVLASEEWRSTVSGSFRGKPMTRGPSTMAFAVCYSARMRSYRYGRVQESHDDIISMQNRDLMALDLSRAEFNCTSLELRVQLAANPYL